MRIRDWIGVFLMPWLWTLYSSQTLLADSKKVWEAAQTLSPLIPPKLSPKEKKLADFGERLFFDTRLSLNGKVACATCHEPEKYFTDQRETGKAIGIGKRNTPTAVNSFALTWSFWDGRADSLASQALKPLEDIAEHGTNRLHAYRLIEKYYQAMYKESFGDLPKITTRQRNALPRNNKSPFPPKVAAYLAKHKPPSTKKAKTLASKPLFFPGASHPKWVRNYESLTENDRLAIENVSANLGLAIAQFERTIIAVESPFDRFVKRWKNPSKSPPLGDNFGNSEFQGLKFFVGKGQCINCHHGPAFTDQQFHNIGFENINMDLGRAEGLVSQRSDQFHCNRQEFKSYPWIAQSASCEEKPFLNSDNLSMVGAFKTPTLRNVAMTFPYGHHGKVPNLEAVIDHYSNLPTNVSIGHIEESLSKVEIGSDDKKNLLAFLRSLTSPLVYGTKKIPVN